MSDTAETCNAEAAGYDGWFGVNCELPKGHEGLHCDGVVEWRPVATEFTCYGRPLDELHECMRATQR